MTPGHYLIFFSYQRTDKCPADQFQSLNVFSGFAKSDEISGQPIHFQGRRRRPFDAGLEGRVDIGSDFSLDANPKSRFKKMF